jgi:Na+-transporting methylmalonyl-CoA/oxaloacetate decarboxylase gamma subunit
MGTVFFGLICLIVICKITSFAVRIFEKKEPKAPDTEEKPISNKQEILAAVCAAVAEETGADTKNIRVLSFKRI